MRFKNSFFELSLEKLAPFLEKTQPLSAEEFKTHSENLNKKFKSKEIGFYDWPETISSEQLQDLQAHGDFLKENFEGSLIIGIGGSYLGAKALVDACGGSSLYWLSNADPSAIQRVYRETKGRKIATVVVSKSGNTTETLAGFFSFSTQNPEKGYVFITDPNAGYLRKLGTKHDWKMFPVPSNIGGRFSVLTAVGLFPAYLADIDAKRVLQGAKTTRDWLETFPAEKNPAYLFASAMHTLDKLGFGKQYLMPYRENLSLLADWYVQLWGESLGKKLRSHPTQAVGPTPIAALGSTDQHSLLQLFQEGPRDKTLGFVDVSVGKQELTIPTPFFETENHTVLCGKSFAKVSSLACEATETSLSQSGVPTYRFQLTDSAPENIGAFFFFFETACAFAGEIYGVNAFDQPGVENTKRLWLDSLKKISN